MSNLRNSAESLGVDRRVGGDADGLHAWSVQLYFIVTDLDRDESHGGLLSLGEVYAIGCRDCEVSGR